MSPYVFNCSVLGSVVSKMLNHFMYFDIIYIVLNIHRMDSLLLDTDTLVLFGRNSVSSGRYKQLTYLFIIRTHLTKFFLSGKSFMEKYCLCFATVGADMRLFSVNFKIKSKDCNIVDQTYKFYYITD